MHRRIGPWLKGLDLPDRNFWLGVGNGIMANGGEAFFHTGLVLAPFLAALGAPAWVIGLIPAIRVGGWFLPQLFVATRLAHVPHKLPLYRRTSTVRTVVFSLLVASIFLLGDRPELLIPISLLMIVINSVAGGIGGVPFADVTGKVVPHYRLGTYWALRNAIGGLLALLSGLVLRRILDAELPFPHDFAWILLLGTLLCAGAYISFGLIREPAGKTSMKTSLWGTLRRLPEVLRGDRSFRRYLRVRFLGLAALLAEPFFAVYALERLGAPTSALGTYIMVATAASIVVNFAFRRPANQGRNATVMRWSLAFLVAGPLLAFFVTDWRVFSLVFALTAAGNSGVGIAAWNLLYALAPEADRPLYVGVANSVLALPSLAPILAGALVGLLGFPFMFLMAGAMAVVSLALAFGFGELAALDRAASLGKGR